MIDRIRAGRSSGDRVVGAARDSVRHGPVRDGRELHLRFQAVPKEVKRPITVTAVEHIRSMGIEVIGVGAFDPQAEGTTIGLAVGWPPKDPAVDVTDVSEDVPWKGPSRPS
jgi:hypothetical protein